MKTMLSITFFTVLVFFQTVASAGELRTLENGHTLYVDYTAPSGQQPVVVLLNGLTDSTENWDLFAAEVSTYAGVLRYDMSGQGQTVMERLPIDYQLPLADQVEDLNLLLKSLGLSNTPVVLAGLSYGGGVGIAYAATHPAKVKAIVAMAPYTRPVKNQDEWVRGQITLARVMNPFYWALFSDDEMYDYFLRVLVYSTYGVEEPSLLDDYPNRMEAALQMITGIRKFDARSVAHLLPAKSLHLVVAGDDEYLQRDELDSFWNAVPLSARASRIDVQKAQHRMPSTSTEFVAGWLKLIVESDPRLYAGKQYFGDKETGLATSADDSIQVTP